MITRDPEYPAEYAQLANAFNLCADGHDSLTALNASIQMVAAAIGFMSRQKGSSLQQTEAYAQHIGECILASVRDNFNRQPQPSDVVVKRS